MSSAYSIQSVSELTAGAVEIASLAGLQDGRYGRLGLDVVAGDLSDSRDGGARVALAPDVGEPDLAARWRGYEDAYRATPRFDAFWLHEIAECDVLPSMMAVKDGVLVRETIRLAKSLPPVFQDVEPAALRAALRRSGYAFESGVDLAPRRTIEQPCFLLGSGMFGNYFNWTIRYAARVAQFQALDPETLLLVPATSKAYVRDALGVFGVPEARIVAVDGPLKARRLILASPTAIGRYDLSPLMIGALRRHPRIQAMDAAPAAKLYVPRANVGMRRVVNEAEVIVALQADGFTVFDNAAYGFGAQAAAFARARTIVAPHGAGLTNLVYAPPGAQVFEAVPEGYDQGVTSYRSLSDLFGHTYAALLCREATPDRRGNRCNSDISIDVAALRALVNG